MSRAFERAAAYLQRHLDDQWTDAEANAGVLSGEIAPLPWPARATSIDWFLWKLSTKILDETEAEAVIDRDRGSMRASSVIPAYVDTARHTLAATLMRLDDDPITVLDAHQAVVFALSPLAVHRMAFDFWLTRTPLEDFAAAWRELPGHAFLAMAASTNDDVVTLLARDAFWRTMLGRTVGV